jgi:hypothetical protein
LLAEWLAVKVKKYVTAKETERIKKTREKEKQETERTDVKRVDCAQPCTQQEEKERHSYSYECHLTQKNTY